MKGVCNVAFACQNPLLYSIVPSFASIIARSAEQNLLFEQVFGICSLLSQTTYAPVASANLFSSISATLGNPGQVNYAAANAALEIIATASQMWGLSVSAEGWGPWGGAGMATQQPALLARLRNQGAVHACLSSTAMLRHLCICMITLTNVYIACDSCKYN